MTHGRRVSALAIAGLVCFGLAVHFGSRSPSLLVWAINHGHSRVAQWMIRQGALEEFAIKSGETPMIRASSRGDVAAVEQLLKEGADVNARSPEGDSALQEAIGGQRDGVLRLLLQRNADPNIVEIGGFRPLLQAASLNRADYASLLLAAGADVNVKDSAGDTALIWACEGDGSLELMTLLISRSADVNAVKPTNRTTPLMWAAQSCQPDVVKFLIDSGADIRPFDRAGANAVFHAALMDRPDNIKMLAKMGADVNARNREGLTALLRILPSPGRTKATQALIDSGADVSAINLEEFAAGSNGNAVEQEKKIDLLRRAKSTSKPSSPK
jgi:ankyrin repeat protein